MFKYFGNVSLNEAQRFGYDFGLEELVGFSGTEWGQFKSKDFYFLQDGKAELYPL